MSAEPRPRRLPAREPATPLTLGRRVFSYASERPTLFVAGTTSSLVVAKIMTVAGYDLNVALGLLTTSDSARVLIAILISLLPLVAVNLAEVACIGMMFGPTEGRISALAAAILLSIVTFFVTPVRLSNQLSLLAILFAIGAFRLVRNLNRASGSEGTESNTKRPPTMDGESVAAGETRSTESAAFEAGIQWIVFALVVLLGILLLYPGLREPWIPRERLLINGQTTTGYVVSIESGWLTYLSGASRELIVVPANLLEERAICSATGDERSIALTLADDVEFIRTLLGRAGTPVPNPACS